MASPHFLELGQLVYCSNVPEAVATRYWDLAAMAVMIVALVSMSALYYLVMRWLNNERDAAVIGVRGGVPLSLTHRWQVFFDWVAMLTGLVGVTAAMIYAFVSIAGMAETESVRWFGYVLAALSGWALLMLALVGGVSDGALIVRTLRAEKAK
jgi:hypothetical protein